MNHYLLLSAADDRRPMLEACIKSIRTYLPGWKLAFTAQTFEQDGYLENLLHGMDYFLHYLPDRVGAHTAKLYGLEWIARRQGSNPYVVNNIDDDMEFTNLTDYSIPCERVMDPGIGFVSCNWARLPADYVKKQDKVAPRFIKQDIVYTGGGMLFNHRLADMILSMGHADFLCDNSEWSLAAYLAGYNNYRFLGSLCLHKIGSVGGRRSWLNTEERQLPDARYLKMRDAGVGFAGKNKFRIGDSKDLTEAAHARHAVNRAALLENARA